MTTPYGQRQAREATSLRHRAFASGAVVGVLAGTAVVLALLVGITETEAAARFAPAELEAKARRGDVVAQFNLARFYDAGDADRQAQARAFALYCQAARQGHAAAAFSVGQMFFSGKGVLRNTAQAAAWFRLATKRGHVLAARLAPH